MATGAFTLTKQHVLDAFAPLGEVADAAARERFFADHVAPDVTWVVPGSAHSLAGTRHSLRAHAEATVERLGRRLRAPIRFSVRRVVVDVAPEPDGWWACVELAGEATRSDGQPYNNEYVWLARWRPDGRIAEVRSYFDTMLSEQALHAPVVAEPA